jgi:hypothetical protein
MSTKERRGALSQPLDAVTEFVTRARADGHYDHNLAGTWSTFRTRAVPPNSGVTVAEAFEKHKAWIESDESTSLATKRTYISRISKILRDFLTFEKPEPTDDGFDWWKAMTATAPDPHRVPTYAELGNRHSSPLLAESSRLLNIRNELVHGQVSVRQPRPPVAVAAPVDEQHILHLGRGRTGSLRLPADVTTDDIDSVWEQLYALRSYLTTRAGVMAGLKRPKPGDNNM